MQNNDVMKWIQAKYQKKFIMLAMKTVFVITIFWIVNDNNDANANEQTQNIHTWLSGYEWSVKESDITKLGKNAHEVLMQIANDQSLMNIYHVRALQTLAFFKNARVADFLQNYIQSNVSHAHQRHALQAFATAFAQQYPDRLAMLASQVLQQQNVHSQMMASQILQQLPQAIAAKHLQTFDLKKTSK